MTDPTTLAALAPHSRGSSTMTEQWDGRPQNPERDGWHWFDAGGSPVTCEWSAARGWRDETWIMRAWELPYLGPCLTPAEVAALTAQRDDWVEQARQAIEDADARVEAARREGIEAAMGAASRRAASRHSTVAHCHSDRSKKHMQIRADEAGQLVSDIRALLEDDHLATAREVMRRRAGALKQMEGG